MKRNQRCLKIAGEQFLLSEVAKYNFHQHLGLAELKKHFPLMSEIHCAKIAEIQSRQMSPKERIQLAMILNWNEVFKSRILKLSFLEVDKLKEAYRLQ